MDLNDFEGFFGKLFFRPRELPRMAYLTLKIRLRELLGMVYPTLKSCLETVVFFRVKELLVMVTLTFPFYALYTVAVVIEYVNGPYWTPSYSSLTTLAVFVPYLGLFLMHRALVAGAKSRGNSRGDLGPYYDLMASLDVVSWFLWYYRTAIFLDLVAPSGAPLTWRSHIGHGLLCVLSSAYRAWLYNQGNSPRRSTELVPVVPTDAPTSAVPATPASRAQPAPGSAPATQPERRPEPVLPLAAYKARPAQPAEPLSHVLVITPAEIVEVVGGVLGQSAALPAEASRIDQEKAMDNRRWRQEDFGPKLRRGIGPSIEL